MQCSPYQNKTKSVMSCDDVAWCYKSPGCLCSVHRVKTKQNKIFHILWLHGLIQQVFGLLVCSIRHVKTRKVCHILWLRRVVIYLPMHCTPSLLTNLHEACQADANKRSAQTSIYGSITWEKKFLYCIATVKWKGPWFWKNKFVNVNSQFSNW